MNLSAFPFYANLNSQDRFRRGCSGEGVFGQLTAQDRFPPFQIKRDRTGDLLDCIHVYRLDGTLFKTVIHPDFPYTLKQTQYDDYIVYYGAAVTGLFMPCVLYYLEVGGYYSEVFQAYTGTDSLVSVIWQNKKTLGGILYGDGFQQALLLDTEILEPDYKFDEEGDTNGDEVFVRDLATLAKIRLLESGSIPEYLVDALNAIPLHDEVYIGDFTELGKITAKTTWLKGACRANVQLSFEDEAPLVWRVCVDDLVVTEVDQSNFFPDLSVCGGVADVRPRWNNTGNTRCKVVEYWPSAGISEEVTRNDCANGMITTSIRYTLLAGRFESLISQLDADRKARDFFDQTKQGYANSNGSCQNAREVVIRNVSALAKVARFDIVRTDTVGDVTINVMIQAAVDYGSGGGIVTDQFLKSFVIPNGSTSLVGVSVGYNGGVLVSFILAEITSTNPADCAF